ncbi:hypothetical protein ACWIUD_00645 [Helicobacter sp. 23-1044]
MLNFAKNARCNVSIVFDKNYYLNILKSIFFAINRRISPQILRFSCESQNLNEFLRFTLRASRENDNFFGLPRSRPKCDFSQ